MKRNIVRWLKFPTPAILLSIMVFVILINATHSFDASFASSGVLLIISIIINAGFYNPFES